MLASVANWLAHVQFARRRGWHALAVALLFTGSVFAQTPGSLDTTPFPGFASGTGKIANLAVGPGSGGADAVAVQSDGKIVLGGSCDNGANFDFCVARLNPDGSLDASFDGPAGSGNGRFLLPIGTERDILSGLAIQSDGKLVLFGFCFDGSEDRFCVARLLTDGTLDASFDGPSGTGDGRFLLPMPGSIVKSRALAIQPDGKLVLLGRCTGGTGNYDFCVARLNGDGSLDAGFVGPNGTGAGRFLLPIGLNTEDEPWAVALEPGGKLVLAGACSTGGSTDFCLARLNPDGSFDNSFDGPTSTGDGRFIVPIGANSDTARAIALQPDGKLIVAGTCFNGLKHDFCIARLNYDGSFDSTYGSAGVSFAGIADNDFLSAIVLQPDGNLVVMGSCTASGNVEFCVGRITPVGFWDVSFDGPSGVGDGRFVLPIGADGDTATALAIQSDGKLVLVGTCDSGGGNNGFCIARLHGGPFHARNCTPDLDGDGLMTATVDALINTRVMLGLRGPSVINGISFPANAKRNTWPAIRDYLVSQCGMSVY